MKRFKEKKKTNKQQTQLEMNSTELKFILKTHG